MLKPNLLPSISLAYISGALYGDGSLRKDRDYEFRMCCGLNEQFADKVTEALKEINLHPRKRLYFPPSFQKTKRKPQWYVDTASIKFVRWFKQLNLAELELTLTTPGLKRAFLAGLLEADGSIYTLKRELSKNYIYGKRRIIEIVTINENLMQFTYNLLQELGYHPRFSENLNLGNPNTSISYKVALYRGHETADFLKQILTEIGKR